MVPALVDLMGRLPYWVDGGRARLSMISADALADAVADLARLPGRLAGQVLHACHPEPVSARELVTTVGRALGVALPDGDVTLEEACARLGAAGDPVTRRRISLLAVDHWYDGSRLWKLVGAEPGPGLPEGSPGTRRGTGSTWADERPRLPAEEAGSVGGYGSGDGRLEYPGVALVSGDVDGADARVHGVGTSVSIQHGASSSA